MDGIQQKLSNPWKGYCRSGHSINAKKWLILALPLLSQVTLSDFSKSQFPH